MPKAVACFQAGEVRRMVGTLLMVSALAQGSCKLLRSGFGKIDWTPCRRVGPQQRPQSALFLERRGSGVWTKQELACGSMKAEIGMGCVEGVEARS